MASVREGVKRLEQLRLVETRHGDGMRVGDWRAHGGLDVLVHAVAHGGGAERGARARGVRGAPRCCSPRPPRSRPGAPLRGAGRAARPARARASRPRGTTRSAQGLDLAFMATVIEAAGNLAFSLIANSIRDVYLQRLDLFRADRRPARELDYAAVAAAIAAGDAAAARTAMTVLARRRRSAGCSRRSQ